MFRSASEMTKGIATVFMMSLGCATSAAQGASDGLEAEKPPIPAWERTGEVTRCLSLYMIRNTTVVDDKTIIFVMRNGEKWLNELPNRCHGLKFEDRFAYRVTLNQLCSTDVVTVIPSNGIEGPSCGLGKFFKVVEPEDKAESGQ